MITQMIHGFNNHILVKAIVGAVVGVFGYFFDIGLVPALSALTVLSLLDLLAAFLALNKDHTEPFSRPIRKTAHKLAGYMVSTSSLFIVSNVIGAMGVDLSALDDLLVGLFLIHEVISIIENLNKSGVPIPLPFLDKLKKVRSIMEDEKDTDLTKG